MSKYFTLSLTIVALLIGLIGGYALSGNTAPAVSKLAMQTAGENEMPKTTDAYSDQQFVQEMILHHQDAVSMSKRVLLHSSRKEVKELATNIIEAQTKEITQMEVWLEEWQ